MKNIEEIIKQFKKIEPSEEYKAHSLRLILSSPQKQSEIFPIRIRIFEMIKFSAALGLTGILMIISLSDIFPTLNARLLSPVLLSNLNEEKIKNEAGQVDIKITVAEARYYNESFQKVAVALDETAKNGPGHLNSTIIEKEIKGLDIKNENTDNIDRLLNELTL